MTHQKEIQNILKKLEKVEKKNSLFENYNYSEKEYKNLKEKINLLYEEADTLASVLCEKHKLDFDEMKSLIREMAISYEKTAESVIPFDEFSREKNKEMKEKIRDAVHYFIELRNWNPKIDPRTQAIEAAKEHGVDENYFINFLKSKNVFY